MTRRRFQQLRRKLQSALAGLVGGFAVACSAPAEVPGLAPRPELVPGAPDPIRPKIPGPTFPTPSDAGAPGDPPPITGAGFYGSPAIVTPPVDAGVVDAYAPLPPVPDGGVRDGGIAADASAIPAADAR